MGARRLLPILAVLALVLTACNGDAAEDTTADPPAADEGAAGTDTDATDTDATDDDAEADQAAADGEPVRIGVITSTSGLLSTYGRAYLDGLEAGLDYATEGSRAVDGRPIELEIVDDAGDPDQAISAAVDLVGQGVQILAGPASSAVALQMASFAEENQVLFISGAAATDALTGVNRYTFRAGRQSHQDVAAVAALVDDVDGATIAAFVQDSEFGAGNVAALENVLGAEGATVEAIEVPLSANEFTPFVQRVADVDPDLVFVAWAGETTPAMWEAMEQQGILSDYTVTTGLGDRASWPLYGPAGPDVQFISHYFGEATDNDVNAYLRDNVDQTDIFTPDGFVTAQMIVRALTEGDPDDVDTMIEALEGWEFDAPKGRQTIRAGDHAMLQPMFTVSMRNMDADPGNIEVEVLDELDPDATAPPER
jgi:branched-chain amino acid transport system substrate-binding protein